MLITSFLKPYKLSLFKVINIILLITMMYVNNLFIDYKIIV